MKKVLLSLILTLVNLGFSLASFGNQGHEVLFVDNSGKIIMVNSTNEETSYAEVSKINSLTPAIEMEEFSHDLTKITKEIGVDKPKIVDDNFIYVKEKRDLIGYALQLASFSDLSLAKEYALKIVKKGDAEKRQLFIYTVNNPEKTYYKVYFGLLKTNESAREKQRNFLALGYSPFVKEFR